MGSAKYFTSIDFHSGYWQCNIADKGIPKTIFLMSYGLYEWFILPMGLMNAPAILMCTMNNLFSDMLDSGMAVFLDDILLYLHMLNEYFTFL